MIKFYAPLDPWGFFSNFSKHHVFIYNRNWRTSEHPFQAMKFDPYRPDLVGHVWEQISPGKAAREGRRTDLPLRSDWNENPRGLLLGLPSREGNPELLTLEAAEAMPEPDDQVNRSGVTAESIFARVKDVIMYEIVLAKFKQNVDLGKALISTGDQVLIEDARDDPYWGWGSSMVGENKLGRILMAVRHTIR